MDGNPDAGPDRLPRNGPAADGSPDGAAPAAGGGPGGQESSGRASADRGTDPAAGSGTDAAGSPSQEPADESGKDAAAAAGEEYAERDRAGVTTVFVYDNRRYGVYAEGSVRARDITGHDKTVTSGTGLGRQPARAVSAVAVAREDRERLRRVAVSAGPRERANAILDRERLVILHGPAGAGKGTAALWLLGFEEEVLTVDPSLTARDLAEFSQRFPYGHKRRYLAEALSSATAGQLTSFVLRAAARDLHSGDGYLVITVDDNIPLSPDLAGFVVAWPDRPDTASVLGAHLDYYLGDGAAASVQERYDLHQLGPGLASRAMRGVDEVARTVAEAFRASRPFRSVLDDLGFGAPARVAQWFTAKRSPEDLGFLLAVTVLGGCPYPTVARHARRLEVLIAEASRIRLAGRPADLMRSRTDRLRETMAVLEPGLVDTEYGPSPAEMPRLENRWLVHAVLDTVWREYDLVADALVSWLRGAGDDPDPGVRLRAAAAAGWLSQYEFAELRRRLFVPWARGTSAASWAAADALGQAAWLDSTAPLALGLLSVWAWQDDDYDLWWTAAVAYGGEAGVRHPGVAMDHLLVITGKGDDRAAPVVAHSLVRLVTSGGRFAEPIAALVLAHLTRWLSHSPAASATAQQAYAELLRRASDPNWPSSQDYWHLLTAPVNQDASARLLRAVLAERPFRAQALEAVQALVRAGDHDQEIRNRLAALLTRVAGAPGSTTTDRDRLLHYLKQWAAGTDPSPAARDLTNRLKEVAET